MISITVGAILLLIAIIIAVVRYLGYYDFGFAYGTGTYGYYFYGLAGIIGLIGIILIAWAYMKKEEAPAATPSQ
jgi:hypothetical protein